MSGKKKQSGSQAKDIAYLTKRVAALEHKAAGTSMATWLAAIGTTLSGLGAFGLGPKPPATIPPSPPAMQDSSNARSPWRLPDPNPLTPYQEGPKKPLGKPPSLGTFIDALDKSKLRRQLFIHAVRETEQKPTMDWSVAFDPAQASQILVDHKQPEDLRAMSALYFGALGNKVYEPTLKSYTSDTSILAKAALLALEMIDETPSKTSDKSE